MSTEFFETKEIVDEIHEIAGVPERGNEHIYGMTVTMIHDLMLQMDKAGLTMAEQRMKMGRKKDELISDLIALRKSGQITGRVSREELQSLINTGALRVKRQ